MAEAMGQKFEHATVSGASRAHLGNVYNYAVPVERPKTPPQASSNVPFRRDPDFINRGDLLDQINTKLSLPGGRVALVGLGGIGKSQLAIAYCYKTREQSPETWIFWIHASNPARFEQSIRDLASLGKIEGRDDRKLDIVKLVSDWLRDTRRGRWLVVIDNADDTDFLFEQRIVTTEESDEPMIHDPFFKSAPICDHGSVLVTTRSEHAARKLVEYAEIIPVLPMSPDDAITLMELKLGKQADRVDISELAEQLEYMPLALTQAAAFIQQMGRRCTIKQYLEKLRESTPAKRSILEKDTGDLRRDPEAHNSILRTWRISFEHIVKIRQSAADLLSLMSFCDRYAIPELLVRRQYRDVVHEQTTRIKGPEMIVASNNRLDDKFSEESSDGRDSEPETSDEDMNDALEDDIQILREHSFLYITTDPAVFQMHRLVQMATRRWLQAKGQFEKWKAQYVFNVDTIFPFRWYEDRALCEKYFPHAKSAADLGPPIDREASMRYIDLMCKAAAFIVRKSFDDSKTLLALASQAGVIELGEHRMATTWCKILIAKANKSPWLSFKNIETQVENIDSFTRLLGNQHSDTLLAMDSLALSYCERGRWNEATDLEFRLFDIRRKLLKADHTSVLLSIADLNEADTDLKQSNEEEQLQAHGNWTSRHGPATDYLDTLKTMKTLSENLREQGRQDQSVKTDLQALELKAKLLAVRKSLSCIACMAATHGQLEKAKEYASPSQIIQDILAIEDVVDDSRLITALLMEYDELFTEAESVYRSALEIRERTCGNEHPETLFVVWKLAQTLCEIPKFNEASELYQRAVDGFEKAFGCQHSVTLSCRILFFRASRNLIAPTRGLIHKATQTTETAAHLHRSKLPVLISRGTSPVRPSTGPSEK